MDIGTADAESFGDECIIPAAPDGEISVGIRDVVEISANNGRIGAFIQLCPDLFGLVAAEAKSVAELFGNRAGGHKDAVIDILDELDVVKILAPEQDRLEVRGIYPHGILSDKHIGCDETFLGAHFVLPHIAQDEGIHDGISRKDDHSAIISAIIAGIVPGKIVIRIMQLIFYVG
jgi:hypothetical protein